MTFCYICDRHIRCDIGRSGNPWYHVNPTITDHEAEPGDS